MSTIRFPTHAETKATLCVYEAGAGVPFDLRRVFTVVAQSGDVRGNHAHKQCTQLLVCVSGAIRVTCDDGSSVSEHLLDDMGTGLLVPPGVWGRQEYLTPRAVLMVLCDRPYEYDDYIRDYAEFKSVYGSANRP